MPHPSARPTPVDAPAEPAKRGSMAICKGCGDEVDELVSVKVQGKTKKLCEECAEKAEEQDAVAQESEAVVQNMMGFKGRR